METICGDSYVPAWGSHVRLDDDDDDDDDDLTVIVADGDDYKLSETVVINLRTVQGR